MKKYIKYLLLSVIILLGAHVKGYAQYVLLEADKAFEQYNYEKAITLYEKAYKKKPTLHAAQRLAECYKNQSDYKQTESWYAIASGMEKSSPENVLEYAKALQSNAKYNEAKVQYIKYADLNKDLDPKIKNKWLLSCDSSLVWMKFPKSVQIKNEKELNSSQSDWGAVQLNENVVFASDRGKRVTEVQNARRPFLWFDNLKKINTVIYGWTGNHYLRLYSKKGSDTVALFPSNVNTSYHIGPASFNGKGDEMYFTLTRIPEAMEYEKVEIIKGKQATVRIEVYSSKKDTSGNWSAAIPFPYNNVNEYSVGDPFLSEDSKRLYFSSTMSGGKGGSDLYVCERNIDGGWAAPINLADINSEGNDRSPAFDSENNFYFSTDGRIEMGGLDIFTAKFVNGKFTTPVNMGYPINSAQDDFAFSSTNANAGYFSSNRMNGLGQDDIYSFIKQQQLVAFKLTGVVYDKNSGQPLRNSIVSLIQTNGNTLKVQTDDDGKYQFNLEKDENYKLTGEKTSYRSDVQQVNTMGLTKSATLAKDLYLEAIVLNKAIKIENIYYDFDKANIRPDAAIELDKLVKIMVDNPTIWIELGSHTDSRGNDAYNQILSQRRANSAVQYIIDRGVSKSRITAVGYGESRLLNKCSNGVKCSVAAHQLNRRTEFTIVKQ